MLAHDLSDELLEFTSRADRIGEIESLHAAGYTLNSYEWSPIDGMAVLKYERTVDGLKETETLTQAHRLCYVEPEVRAKL